VSRSGNNAWQAFGNSPPSLRSGGGYGGSGLQFAILDGTPLSSSFIGAGGSAGGGGPGGGQYPLGVNVPGHAGQARGAGGFGEPVPPGQWNADAGRQNTGGGGGGGKSPYQANTGGSGVVVVRYPFF